MAKVRRDQFRTFIDTTPKAGSATFALLGKGISDSAVNANPQTETEHYISDKEATTDTNSYQRALPFDARLIMSDEALAYLEGLWRDGPPVLDDAVTEIVNVYTYHEKVEGKYPATKHEVSIAYDNFGGTGGDGVRISGNLNYRGDQVNGWFDPVELEFTATEESA
jgi:hypothetical protein